MICDDYHISAQKWSFRSQRKSEKHAKIYVSYSMYIVKFYALPTHKTFLRCHCQIDTQSTNSKIDRVDDVKHM